MNNVSYVIVIEKTATGFSAYAPDLPGCVAAGDSLDETVQLMREAIELYLDELRHDGLPTPESSTTTTVVEIGLSA